MKMDEKRGLNSNQLKIIAIFAMTADHLACVMYPNYPRIWWVILIHIIGRTTAPIMWFMVSEGYNHTRNLRKYITRLFAFASVSHFAYNFAFGIPFLPFKTSVLNQTSVIWSLAWGVVALALTDENRFKTKPWQRVLIVLAICAVTFCSDWSCIAVLAILGINSRRGSLKAQTMQMMFYVSIYALVYYLFIDKVYGLIQFGVILSVPLMACYNGKLGKPLGTKWFFYIYYPAHLFLCGILRVILWGNVKLM